MNKRYLIIIWCLIDAQFGAMMSYATAADGLEWGNFQVTPMVTLSERHSDNIYLVDRNKTEDSIFAIAPELSIKAAIVPRNNFSFKYRGDYFSYSSSENFKEKHHFGSLSFNSHTRNGSHLMAGYSTENTAVQPFSGEESAKDYIEQSVYADILISFGRVVEIGTEINREDREFDEAQFTNDDFTRQTWDLHVLYAKSPIWPLLVQYRHINQDNNHLDVENTDFKSHTVFVGGRWRPDTKLSGTFRIGYLWAQFNDPSAQGYDGYAVDTNLKYTFSDITQFTLTAARTVHQPTISARESGDYNVSTIAGLIITHRRWKQITTRLDIFYRNKDYKEIQSSESVRKDNYYRAGLLIAYSMRCWISFSLGYNYQENNSNIEIEEYKENSIEFGIGLSM